jgi:F-type H+-transporting ATPase subunit epsilon
MAELFTLEVHTPYRRFFAGDIEALTLTLSDGGVTVLAHHLFFIAPVLTGVMRIKDKKGVWKSAFTGEGVLEVKHNTILMVNAAEWPGEIDRERALAAQKRAQDAVNSSTFKFESGNAEAALRRAEFRLRVSAVE